MRYDMTKRLAAAVAAAVMMTASFSSVMPTITAAGGDSSGISESTPSVSMSLLAGGSEIGMIFYLNLPGDIDDYTITLNDSNPDVKSSGNGYYITAAVNAMDMMFKHSIVVSKDGENIINDSISVCDYLNQIVNGGADMNDYKPLAKAMLMYGASAQDYFGVETEGSPSDGITDADYSNVSFSAAPFNKATFNNDLNTAPISYYGMNLSLKSKLNFTLFFELKEDVEMEEAINFLSGFQFGGIDTEVKANGTHFVECSIGVPASKLDEEFELTSGEISAVFSPAQYFSAAKALNDAKLTDVCKALYAYGAKAKELADAPSADEKWMSDVTHSGDGTHYELKNEGCANLDDFAKDEAHPYETCALSVADYNGAVMAGAYLEVTDNAGNKAYVLVTDRCADPNEMHAGDIDIDELRFTQGGNFLNGRIPVTWRVMPLPSADDGNIIYQVKNGSSQYWCQIQVRNHRYPVAKLEYKNASGEFVEVPRQDYNYFEFSDGIPDGKATFRITDIYGEQIIDENVDLKFPANGTVGTPYGVTGSVQFTK